MENKDEITSSFQDLHNAAMWELFSGLVQHLHERGSADGLALVQQIQSRQAFGRAAFREQNNPVLTHLVSNLQTLMLATGGKQSSGE